MKITAVYPALMSVVLVFSGSTEAVETVSRSFEMRYVTGIPRLAIVLRTFTRVAPPPVGPQGCDCSMIALYR